jgi:hypothetical protein
MKPNLLRIYINGVGICGPGLSDWPSAQAVLTHKNPYQADTPEPGPVTELPAAERRRVGTLVKLAFAAGRQALHHAQTRGDTLQNVFTSSSGDGDNCNELFATLAGADRQISPTRFHNSVHNAAAGYWSIAQACTASSTSLCAHDGSFCAGLLEAVGLTLAHQRPTLLVSYDCPYPEPLFSARPVQGTLGIALIVAPEPGPHTLCGLTLQWTPVESVAPTSLAIPEIEALRQHNPTGRGLPLLELLARPDSLDRRSVELDYLPGCPVRITRIDSPSFSGAKADSPP